MSIVMCKKCRTNYDNEKYSICPNCGRVALDEDRTVAIPADEKTEKTYDETLNIEGKLGESIASEVTVGAYSIYSGNEYIVGWLVCIEGKSKGRDYKLHHGWNRIGRSQNMQVIISDDKGVSREHGAVIYDDKANSFYVVNKSGTLIYLNDKTVLDVQPLESGDTIKLGNSEFTFIAFCTEERKW